MSCKQDDHELIGTRIKVHAKLRILLKSSFASWCKLEMSCKQPGHLPKNLASDHLLLYIK